MPPSRNVCPLGACWAHVSNPEVVAVSLASEQSSVGFVEEAREAGAHVVW